MILACGLRLKPVFQQIVITALAQSHGCGGNAAPVLRKSHSFQTRRINCFADPGFEVGPQGIAHSVYNGLTILDELTAMHGECVAFGTITQLILEAAPREELEEVMNFCHEVGLPCTLAEMGISDKDHLMQAAKKACAPGESIHFMPGDVTPQQLYAAMLTADALGNQYYG